MTKVQARQRPHANLYPERSSGVHPAPPSRPLGTQSCQAADLSTSNDRDAVGKRDLTDLSNSLIVYQLITGHFAVRWAPCAKWEATPCGPKICTIASEWTTGRVQFANCIAHVNSPPAHVYSCVCGRPMLCHPDGTFKPAPCPNACVCTQYCLLFAASRSFAWQTV